MYPKIAFFKPKCRNFIYELVVRVAAKHSRNSNRNNGLRLKLVPFVSSDRRAQRRASGVPGLKAVGYQRSPSGAITGPSRTVPGRSVVPLFAPGT